MGVESGEGLNSAEFVNSDTRYLRESTIPKNQPISLKSTYFTYLARWSDWLKHSGVSEGYQRDIQRALERIFKGEVHTAVDVLEFIQKLKCNKKYHQLAFRKWVKFCEEKDILDEDFTIRLKNKIKVNEKSGIDGYVPSDIEIKTMLDEIQEYCSLSFIFLKVLLDSGLRISEVTHFLHTIDKHKPECYDDIVIIPLYYLRGNKNSYYVFLSKGTYDLVLEHKREFQEYTVVKLKEYIKRHHLVSLKYFRKYQFTKMIQAGIPLDVANFIQGRVSANIGFNHYLAKKEISIVEYRKYCQKN